MLYCCAGEGWHVPALIIQLLNKRLATGHEFSWSFRRRLIDLLPLFAHARF